VLVYRNTGITPWCFHERKTLMATSAWHSKC
jgi:hypothetical protein